jgi:hypothetical protein
MHETSLQTIRVDFNHHDAWEVTLPDPDGTLTCETLDDARCLARLCAARRRPCELVIRDAYHRVVVRETLDAPGASISAARC